MCRVKCRRSEGVASYHVIGGAIIAKSERLAAIAALVEPLSRALGPDVEVVLHDLSRIPDSIMAVAGNVTGRRDGGPSSDLLLKHIRSGDDSHLFNYASVSVDGKPMTSSSMFIHDADGTPIGCLCINRDVSALAGVRDLLDAFIGAPLPGLAAEETESFAVDAEQVRREMLDRALAANPIPAPLMRKTHRVRVVAALDEQGFFLMKDAVEFAAARLGVTRFTVYNYLQEIRGNAPQH